MQNIKLENFLKKNIEHLQDLQVEKEFFNLMLNAQSMKGNFGKLVLAKIKKLL